jgi:hypothetical protein
MGRLVYRLCETQQDPLSIETTYKLKLKFKIIIKSSLKKLSGNGSKGIALFIAILAL